MDTVITQISPILYESIKQTGGIVLMDMSGINEKINFGDNYFMNQLANGTKYYTAEDIVNYISTGKSEILNMDVYKIGDGIVYNGIVHGIIDGVGVKTMVYNQVSKYSPLPDEYTKNFVRAFTMVCGKTAGSIIKQTNKNPLLNYVFNPVSTILKPKRK